MRMEVVRCWTVAVTALLIQSFTFAAHESDNVVPCLENGRFYRNPKQRPERYWITSECAKYYLCLDGEVFEFKCSEGLLFDVKRQICDFKINVDNCDLTSEWKAPKPLLAAAKCSDPKHLGCADGTCLPSEFFCDGSVDCIDESDEEWCDANDDPNAALPCDPSICQLPECYCSPEGTLIPGQLDKKQVPQMIILTFDDAVNSENWNTYINQIFSPNRTNPNGCPIHATFFISHQYTNYHYIQKLWNNGHEIAVHSITHRGPENWWSRNASIEDWFDEMVGQANIINKFAGVHMEDIRGLRVPFLRIGWNRQFLMMREFGFVYDSSMVAPYSEVPLWPYTLDHKMPHKCHGINQRCPSRSYPGIWEMVMNQLNAEGYTCGMVDSCPTHFNGEDVYNMLHSNLQRHFKTNRAPLGLYFHGSWFQRPEYLKAFQRFLDDIQKRSDVWVVSNWEAIKWIQNPTPLGRLNQFQHWSCHNQVDPEDKACEIPNNCKLHSRVLHGERYLTTCFDCPQQYPWIRNEFGQS